MFIEPLTIIQFMWIVIETYRHTPTLLCVDHAKWWIWKRLGFSNLWTEIVLCILCTILPKQKLNTFSLFSDYNVRDFHLSSIGIQVYLYGFIIDSHKLHFLSYCVKLYNMIKYLCHTKMIKKRFLKNYKMHWLSTFNIICIRSAEIYCLYVTFTIFMPPFVKRGGNCFAPLRWSVDQVIHVSTRYLLTPCKTWYSGYT